MSRQPDGTWRQVEHSDLPPAGVWDTALRVERSPDGVALVFEGLEDGAEARFELTTDQADGLARFLIVEAAMDRMAEANGEHIRRELAVLQQRDAWSALWGIDLSAQHGEAVDSDGE